MNRDWVQWGGERLFEGGTFDRRPEGRLRLQPQESPGVVIPPGKFRLSAMLKLEPVLGVRKNGPLLVLGQTAMFFYLEHRFAFDAAASYGGLLGIGTISATYGVGILMLAALYPRYRGYRSVKAARPQSFLRYL